MSDDEARNNGENRRKPQPPVEFQFKPGNPGRPKGARNRLGEQFLEDLLASWETDGPTAIKRVIEKRPQDYLRVVASILPKDINVNVNQIESMTDEQLVERIRKLDATIRPFLDAQGAGGTGGGDKPQTAH